MKLAPRNKERLTFHRSAGPKNSMQYWHKMANPFRVIRNFLLIYTARFLPSVTLKNVFYRWCGAKIGRDVSFGLCAMMDIFFPEEITIGDNTVVGYNTVFLGHEFLRDDWRRGPVVVGRDVKWRKLTADLSGQSFEVEGTTGSYKLTIPLLGAHQLENAATAVAALEAIGIESSSIRKGMAQVRWPGRLEVLQREPALMVDAAHNADSARRVCRWMSATPRPSGEIRPTVCSTICANATSPKSTGSRSLASTMPENRETTRSATKPPPIARPPF